MHSFPFIFSSCRRSLATSLHYVVQRQRARALRQGALVAWNTKNGNRAARNVGALHWISMHNISRTSLQCLRFTRDQPSAGPRPLCCCRPEDRAQALWRLTCCAECAGGSVHVVASPTWDVAEPSREGCTATPPSSRNDDPVENLVTKPEQHTKHLFALSRIFFAIVQRQRARAL